MKKKCLVNLLMLSLIGLMSCTENENPEYVRPKKNPNVINLSSGGSCQLNVKDEYWFSDDEFVAMVSSSGKVTANYVGTTKIRGNDKVFTVNVNPECKLYNEPIMTWGMSKDLLIDENGVPDYEDENMNGILYKIGSVKCPAEMYYFNDNDELKSSVVVVNYAYASELTPFLKERYQGISIEGEDDSLFAIDALDVESATKLINIDVDFQHGVIYICYMDIAYFDLSSKTKSEKDLSLKFKEMYRAKNL